MLFSRTGVMTLWTDIEILCPALSSGPTAQRTYGSLPRHNGGQDAPDSWLRHTKNAVTSLDTDGGVAHLSR